MLPSSHNANDPNIAPFPFPGDLITNPKPDQDLLLPFSSLINFPSSPLSIYTEQDGFIFLPPALPDYSFPDNKVDVMEPSKQLLGINEETMDVHTKREHRRKEVVPRKRSSKKDRHSKIETAQGPRDRRMRLSLDVARKFFDLQDILGFDKASKTVEWLLNQSRSAIKDLSKDFSNTCKLTGEESNSLSECDVVSGVCDEAIENFNDEDRPDRPEHVSKGSQSSMKVRKTGSQASMRKVSTTQLARESREKARARAKERTREKMLIRQLNVSADNGSKLTAETSEEEGKSQLGHNNINILPPMQEVVQAEVDESKWLLQAANEEIMTEDSLTMSTGNYLQNGVIFQENQLRYSQLYLKPWEAYNGSSCNF